MNRRDKRNTFIFRVAAGLLLAVLLTMRLFAGVPARYSSTSDASDSARVARYALTVTGNATKEVVINHQSGNSVSGNYTFTVSNVNANSEVCEVAMRYTVRVTLPSPLLEPVSLTLNGNAPTSVTNGGKTLTFNGNTTFDPTQPKTFTETLTFTVASSYDGNTYVDFNQVNTTVPTSTAIYYLDGINVDVISEQID